MMKIPVFFTATMLLGAASSAHADLSLSGAVGLPLNPTAQVPAPKTVQLQGSYTDLGDLDALSVKVSEVKSYGLHATGLLGKNIELSVGGSRLKATDPANLGADDLSDTNFSLGIKYQITQAETAPCGVSTALGASYDRANFHNRFIYAVASKPFPLSHRMDAPAMVHLGLRYDHFSVSDLGGPDSDNLSIYGGLEAPLTRRGDFALIGEIGTKNNDLGREKNPYSLGIRYQGFQNRLSASVGIQRQGVTGDDGIYARLGFSFG